MIKDETPKAFSSEAGAAEIIQMYKLPFFINKQTHQKKKQNPEAERIEKKLLYSPSKIRNIQDN